MSEIAIYEKEPHPPVVHYRDEVEESSETYRVVARVLRWETGELDADGVPVIRECGSGSCGRATATGTIIDSTEPPEPERPVENGVVRIYGQTKVDEGGEVTLRVEITSYSKGSLYPAASVDWATRDETAIAGADYTASSGTIHFPAASCDELEPVCGQVKDIKVQTLQDEAEEDDYEQFVVALSNPMNARFPSHGGDREISVTITDDEKNTPPVVTVTAEKTRVAAGERIWLEADASDKEGPVTIRWSGAGRWDSRSSAVTRWRAPSPPSDSDYTLYATVTDEEGATAEDSVTISVGAREEVEADDNEPPTVTLAAAATTVREGKSLTLTVDADDYGDIASTAFDGLGTFGEMDTTTDPWEVAWTAPGVDASTDITLSVTVTDDEEATASDSISVRVTANQAPTVTIPAADFAEMPGGSTVTLTAVGHDADGTIASYAWEGSGEFDDPTMSEVEWTAPSPAAATSYTLSVTAVDNDGESSEAASIVARVAGVPPTPNRPPTVVLERAGSSNYTVSGGARFIILKATVSDPDGDRFGPGNFEFTGDGLLSRTTTVHQNPVRGLKDWSPPKLSEETQVTMRVRVSDGNGGVATASRVFTVRAHDSPNTPPVVSVTSSATGQVNAGASVTLTATATDSDGIASYRWRGAGTFGSSRAATTTWTAPAPKENTTYTLTVGVKDRANRLTEEEVTVEVAGTDPGGPENRPPTATINTLFEVVAGGEVVVSGRNVTDPDGTIVSEVWSVWSNDPNAARPEIRDIRIVGPNGEHRIAKWTAPATATVGTVYRFRLTVTDDDGAETTSTTRDLTIIAGDSRNNRPVVRISDPDTLRVASGATLALEATASDSDGTVESYAWSAAQADDATASGVGAFATRGAGARADWTAPTPTNATDYVLTVTVTDDDGGEGSASVTVTVIGTANTAPTVTLTADKDTVGAGGRIQLRARAEDRDGAIATYAWSCTPVGDGCSTDHTALELSSTPGRATWPAPSPSEDTGYTWKVTVTDDGESPLTATASVTVTVTEDAEEEGTVEDALPVVTFDPEPGIVDEGTTVTINILLDKQAPSGASIRYEVGDESQGRTEAQPCADYERKVGRIDLGGRTEASLSFGVLADACDERNEQMAVRFYDAAKVRLDFDTVSLEIRNQSAAVEIVIPNDAYETGDDGSRVLGAVPIDEGSSRTLTVKRTATNRELLVPASVEVVLKERGRSTAGEDFSAGPYTVEFGQGVTSGTFTVEALNDDEYGEAGEGFRVTLEKPRGLHLGATYSVDFKIGDRTDVPNAITVSTRALTPSVLEGETARCEISVIEAEERVLDSPIRVWFWNQAESDGPRAGVDYHPTSGEWVDFGLDGNRKVVREVQTEQTQKNTDDDKMVFTCEIGSDPADATRYEYEGNYPLQVDQSVSEVRILNIPVGDDDPTAMNRGPVWGYDQTTTEGQSVSFQLHLNGELPAENGVKVPLVVNWRTSDEKETATATAGSDYITSSGTHTFQPGGTTSFNVTVPVRCDREAEGVEHFHITADGQRSGTGDPVGGTSELKITILPKRTCGGGAEIISIADGMNVEGQNIEFAISVAAHTLGAPVLIDYETRNGTARAGSDYEAAEDTLTIASASGTVSIRTLADDVRDDGETFEVRLSNARTNTGLPVGFADAIATGTIVEKEPIAAEFRGGPANHSGGAFNMELHLTAPLEATATQVAAAITVDGADLEAEKRSDLVWRLTVTPARSGNISIALDHTAITGANGRSVAPLDAVTVYGRSTVSIDDSSATESTGIMRFTASLDATANAVATVDWRTADGTAINGQDYEATTGTLRFEPGETEAVARVKLFRTTRLEPDETFTVTLENPSGSLIIDPDHGTATGTIKDNSVGVEFDQPASPRTDDSNFTVPLRFRPSSFEAEAADVLAALRVKHKGYRSECALEEGQVDVVGVTPATGTSNSFEAEINPGGTCHIELVIARGSTFGHAVMQYDAQVWIMGPRACRHGSKTRQRTRPTPTCGSRWSSTPRPSKRSPSTTRPKTGPRRRAATTPPQAAQSPSIRPSADETGRPP